jgi:hypothetical protein
MRQKPAMHIARRTHGFTESVVRGMTRLATAHAAINLVRFAFCETEDVLAQAAERLSAIGKVRT